MCTLANREDPVGMPHNVAVNQGLHCLLRKTYWEVITVFLSYDVASGSEITSCNKIDKALVVYRFTGNVMTSITTLRT